MTKKEYLDLLTLMIQCREIDDRSAVLVRQGKGYGHVPSKGHEALMTVSYLLKEDDYLYPYYRGYHHMIGKGISPEQIAKDFFAKSSSSSQGFSASTHCSSVKYKVFPSAAPTASQCLPATGSAWGQKLEGHNNITLCSIGDAATREGEFYEAVCQAVQKSLPIVFLVEDNHYGISTPTKEISPFRLNIFHTDLFKNFNGRDVNEVFRYASEAIEKARNGFGPTMLWGEVDRLGSHTVGEDHRLYRAEQELNSLSDPIKMFSDFLIEKGFITKDELVNLRARIKDQVNETFEMVWTNDRDPEPQSINLHKHLYGETVQQENLSSLLLKTTETTMVESINSVLNLALRKNEKIIMFGQDIEDPKGGVFGFTKGLSTAFPDRVLNAPISEATIIGSAVGLAIHGYKPVFEIQFIDFITPGFDQLVSHVSSLRWRSCSQWTCPMVLYAPYGAYIPGAGLWHSQSNDGWWTHIPGIRVAIPSSPEDAAGLFWSAIQDNDPSLILIPKNIFRKRKIVTQFDNVPFGKGKIIKEGKDVIVVSWGNTVHLAEEAADDLSQSGVSIEVIDLRTLVPCDWDIIAKSLEKTGRLVVVHEDNKTGGFGESILARITSDPEYFSYLYAPPQLVARNDIHIPYHPHLLSEVLPSTKNIIDAIKLTLQ